jgi:flagellum-specific ATP synthase
MNRLLDNFDIDDILDDIDSLDTTVAFGVIKHISSTVVTAIGLNVAVGDIVKIISEDRDGEVLGMVVGIDSETFQIIPFSFVDGLKIRDRVYLQRSGLSVRVGYGLIGRVLDALGEPIDDKEPLSNVNTNYSINKPPMSPLKRGSINQPFMTGVKAIDSMLTVGKGQKLGIFAGSGVGKSTLMGMIVRGCVAEIKVVALIGERGREIPEFIEYNLNNNLENTILIVATSDDSALMRKYGAFSAMAIAEFFRDNGHDVLLIMDSVTRFAMAQREIGMSTGEPPVSRGYPPSVFALLPQLMERVGNSKNGSMTAFFTVLVDGDDMNDPVADQSRSILDGHIVLTRELAESGFYPPIDVLKSASRVMDKVTTKEHYNLSLKLKRVLSQIRENEVLVRVGAYKKGSDPSLDYALSKKDKIVEFLTQSTSDTVEPSTIQARLEELFND